MKPRRTPCRGLHRAPLGLLGFLAAAAVCAEPVQVDVIKQPYGGARNVPEISTNPDYIHAAGLERLLGEWGGELIRPVQDVRLDAAQERQYGEWHRMAMANGNMAALVREVRARADLVVGLEANCNVLLGMLAGLAQDDDGGARRLGLVFIDAHGDFNVPETTLSGMLGAAGGTRAAEPAGWWSSSCSRSPRPSPGARPRLPAPGPAATPPAGRRPRSS